MKLKVAALCGIAGSALLSGSMFAGVLVNLDATALPVGPVSTWSNTGTATGDFTATGTPEVTSILGVKGVTLAGNGQYFAGPIAPSSIAGVNPNRSIEAWVYNPAVADEETIIAWGHRGGGDGTNMSFNYGSNGSYGAVGHWGGGPDVGWVTTGGAPAAGTWHYLVYTYDGGGQAGQGTTRVYADGVLMNSEFHGNLNTHDGDPFVVGGQNQSAATPGGFNSGFTLARVRVHDTVLSPATIAATYTTEFNELFPLASLQSARMDSSSTIAFTVVDNAPNSVVDPSTFSIQLNVPPAGWLVTGANAGPANGSITSPPVTITATGEPTLTFTHRYSFEYDGTAWDGGAVYVSIDGGGFTQLAAGDFTEGGYTRPITGNNVLFGLDGFNGDSPGYATGAVITSVVKLPPVLAGSTVQVRFLGAWDEGAMGQTPNWEIQSVTLDVEGTTPLDEDFSSGDGGFTAESTGNAGSSWTFRAGTAPLMGTLTSQKVGDVTTFTLPIAWVPFGSYPFVLSGQDTAAHPLSFAVTVNAPALVTAAARTWPATLPAPAGKAGFWGVRTYLNEGIDGAESLDAMLAFLQSVARTPADSPNDVIDTYEPYLNFYDPSTNGPTNGLLGCGRPFPGDALSTSVNGGTARDDNHVVSVARGAISITQDSDYTFNFRGDDGFMFRITAESGPAPTFFATGGGAVLDEAARNIVFFPVGTGDADSRAAVHLAPGTYLLEYATWEGQGGFFYQVAAAKGLFLNNGDTNTWAAVGFITNRSTPVAYPSVTGGWTVQSTEAGALLQKDLAGVTQAVDAAVAADAVAATSTWPVINFTDPEGAGAGRFASDSPWPRNTSVDDNSYGLRMTGTLHIPQEGDYLIGYHGDDGSSLTLGGTTASFSALVENATNAGVIARATALVLDNAGSLGATSDLTTPSAQVGVPGALAGSTDTALRHTAGQNVSAPWSAELNPSDAFSVEGWFRPAVANAPTVLTCAISSGHFADPRTGWLIYQSDTGWNFRTYFNSGTATAVSISGGDVPVVGEWYHLVATWDGTVGRIYVNGEIGATSDPVSFVAAVDGSFRIGARADNQFFWAGDVDEVAFYPTALSDAVVAAHYANGLNAGRTQPYEALVQASSPLTYWRLNETDSIPRSQLRTEVATGNSSTVGLIHLTPGDYPVSALFWEDGGGSSFEIFASQDIGGGCVPQQLLGATAPASIVVTSGLTLIDTPAGPAPVITSLTIEGGGALSLTFNGVEDASYTLEESTTLAEDSWQPVKTFTAFADTFTLTGTPPPAPDAFFYYDAARPAVYWRLRRNP